MSVKFHTRCGRTLLIEASRIWDVLFLIILCGGAFFSSH